MTSKPPAHHAPLRISSRLSQLTVGELRRALADAPDYTPVLMECVSPDHTAIELVDVWGADYASGFVELYLTQATADQVLTDPEDEGDDEK